MLLLNCLFFLLVPARTCGDTSLETWPGLVSTINYAWVDGVFSNYACEWQINALPGYIVQLTVVAFETQACCENVTVSTAKCPEQLFQYPHVRFWKRLTRGFLPHNLFRIS